MMKRFKKYIRRKVLLLRPDQIKIMVFERRGNTKKMEWKSGEKNVKVMQMRYLGYIMQKKEGTEKHIMERIRRAIMKQTCMELGRNFSRKIMGEE